MMEETKSMARGERAQEKGYDEGKVITGTTLQQIFLK